MRLILIYSYLVLFNSQNGTQSRKCASSTVEEQAAFAVAFARFGLQQLESITMDNYPLMT
jgi:hypothetical protein